MIDEFQALTEQDRFTLLESRVPGLADFANKVREESMDMADVVIGAALLVGPKANQKDALLSSQIALNFVEDYLTDEVDDTDTE